MRQKNNSKKVLKVLAASMALSSIVCGSVTGAFASAATGFDNDYRYFSDYGTWEDCVEAAEEVKLKITEEGILSITRKV